MNELSGYVSKKMFLGVVMVAVMFVGALALSSEASAQTTVVSASEFTYSGVMKVGMSGPGISTLQAALNTVNTGVSTVIVDGKFGPATMGAVQRFQSQHGLVADGVVGPMTGEALRVATRSLIVVPITPPTTGLLCPNGKTVESNCTTTPIQSGFFCPNGKTLASNCTSSGSTPAPLPSPTPPSPSPSPTPVAGSGPHPVSTSATLISVDGTHNDLGEYTIKLDVSAFGHDAFISQSGTVAYHVWIEDASTGTVLTPATISTVVSSTADTEGGSYRIDEGTSESFTFTITVDPVSADEGKSIRAQLLSIDSGSTSGSPTGNLFSISSDNMSQYRTNGVVIPD